MTNLCDRLPSLVGRRAAALLEPSLEQLRGVIQRVALLPGKYSKLNAEFARRADEPEPLRHPRRLPVAVLDVPKRASNEGVDMLAHVLR